MQNRVQLASIHNKSKSHENYSGMNRNFFFFFLFERSFPSFPSRSDRGTGEKLTSG